MNLCPNWLRHNLVVCVFLFEDPLFNTYCCFINIGLMANSTITDARMKLFNLCIFSIGHIRAFLCSGTLDSTLALCFAAFSTAKSPRKMKNYIRKWHLKKLQKPVVCSVRAEKRRQSVIVFNSAGMCVLDFLLFCMCLWMTTEVPVCIDLRVTHKF